MRTPRLRAGWVAALAALSLTLAACAGSSDPRRRQLRRSPAPRAAPSSSGTTKAPTAQWVSPGTRRSRSSSPSTRACRSTSSARRSSRSSRTPGMIISSDEGPDIMEYNKGNATAGLLASQGLLTDLTEQATEPWLGQGAAAQPADHRPVRREGRDGLRQLVRRPELRRVRHGLLQQGPVRRERHCRFRRRWTSSPPRWTPSSQAGTTPLCMAGAEYPAGQLALPAGAVQGGPVVRRRLPAVQEPGRLPGRPAEVRRGDLRPVGEEGLHRQGFGVAEGRGHGHRVHRRQVPDDRFRQLVVRPVHRRDQGFRLGHLPVSRATS